MRWNLQLSHAGGTSHPSEHMFAGVYEVKEAEPKSMVYKRKSLSIMHEV